MALLLALLIIALSNAEQYAPEQIHIALGPSPDIIAFTYQTWDYPLVTTANVRIGESSSTLDRIVRGETHLFTDPNSNHTQRVIHVVNVTNLKASTRYFYQVGDDEYGWSKQTFSFKTIWNAETLKESIPQKIIFLGDLGETNDQILPALINESVHQQQADIIVHLGDIAYNLDSNQGENGDAFMNQIQRVAANVPYMVCLGNHESAFNFSHYSQKFRGQPSNSGNVWTFSGQTPNNWYFSYNAGMIHFVVISTEIYFDFPFLIKEQFEWVQQDLIAANKNRTAAPWIIVYGHRPLYCSSTPHSDCGAAADLVKLGVQNATSKQYQYGMEELFYSQGVDFYICGHEHNYERMYDIYHNETTQSTKNMPSTTYIVSGSAGSNEGKEGFGHKQPVWSAYRTQYYSFTRFYVYNASHIHLQQVVADATVSHDENHMVCDDVWYVQEHHGPFADNLEKRSKNQDFEKARASSITVLKPGPDRASKDKERRVEYIGDDKESYRGVEGVYF